MIDRAALSALEPLDRAAFAIRVLETRMQALQRERCEPIAIIGMACRFPGGANDPDCFWQLLAAGFDANREIPPGRFDVEAYFDQSQDKLGKMYVRRGAFMDDVDQFDPAFFAISPREAERMDPQHRLLLETSWEAIENAGIAPTALRGSNTGTFLGIGQNDYIHAAIANPGEMTIYEGSGNGFSFASGRVSYVLGLQGPNLAVDTACSSSLVSVHLACQALRRGECEMALAAGSHLVLSPLATIALCNAHVLSSDGRSKPFDASADGYGRGEGCGVVVLKRLSDAQAAGDRILAVIRGSAVNHGGAASGLMAPSEHAQQAVVSAALRDARVLSSDVDLVETHGTGTSLGDPIEVAALGRVFSAAERRHPLVLGAVKGNFGHLEAAAGIIGLIKVVQCLRYETIPANLHLRTPNPLIPWDRLAMELPRRNRAWCRSERARVAGVSSFGISGTNAHVVVSEAPLPERAVPERTVPERGVVSCERGAHLLMVSARTEAALSALCGRMADRLGTVGATAELGDVCFTANSGRSRFAHGLAVVGGTGAEMARLLASAARGETPVGVQRNGMSGGVSNGMRMESAPKIGFLFTGQGAQHVGMGRALYAGSPVFRAAIDRCAGVLEGLIERPLVALLQAGTAEELAQTGNTQPALFAIEWALSELWRSWGIEPAGVLGHSVGEYVAACVAGVMTVEDALRLIAARGRLMQALPADAGAMVAVLADEARVSRLVADHAEVSIAAVNGPESVVISGRRSAVRALVDQLSEAGVRTQPLAVSHAFHSPLMAPMLAAFGEAAAGVTFHAPVLPLVSNVTGTVLREAPTAAYWVAHVSAPVRFADGLTTLARSVGCTALLELGPRPTLLGLGRAVLPDHPGPWLASLRPERGEWEQMLSSLGSLALAGSPVNWQRYDQPYHRHKTTLPTYPFQRQRFWPDMLRPAEAKANEPVEAPPPTMTASLGRVEWHSMPWPQPNPMTTGRWLLLADTGGVAASLAERLRDAGADVIMMPLNIASGIDAVSEWRRLLGSLSPLAGVVHLFSQDLPADPTDVTIDGILSHCVEPILAMARLHADAVPAAPLWIVTAGAVGPGDRRPAAAPLWGLARVLQAEHPRSLGGLIDLPALPGTDDIAALLRLLTSPPTGGRFAVRHDVCLVERLVSIGDARVSPALDPHGAYLVTGGLGGIGLVVARALARWGGRRLVLLGRQPHRHIADAIVREFGITGVAVDIRAVDVTDAAALTALLADLDSKGWALAGVIHAAGVLDDGLLSGQTADQVRAVMASKVAGAINLHRLTQKRYLDFLILLSSTAGGIGGSVGQGAYAAANAFLDALAEYRQQQGRPGRSILWGPWTVGMGADLEPDTLTAAGLRALSPDEGERLLAGALFRDEPALVAAAADWSRAVELESAASRTVSAPPIDPLADLDRANAAQRRTILSSYVDGAIRAVLLLPDNEPLPPRQPLLEFGFDSMSATNLRNRVTADIGIELPLHLLLSGAFPEQIVDVLHDRLTVSIRPTTALSLSNDDNAIEEFIL